MVKQYKELNKTEENWNDLSNCVEMHEHERKKRTERNKTEGGNMWCQKHEKISKVRKGSKVREGSKVRKGILGKDLFY